MWIRYASRERLRWDWPIDTALKSGYPRWDLPPVFSRGVAESLKSIVATWAAWRWRGSREVNWLDVTDDHGVLHLPLAGPQSGPTRQSAARTP